MDVYCIMVDREPSDYQNKSSLLIKAAVQFSVPFPTFTALQSMFLKLHDQYQFLNIIDREHTVVHRYDQIQYNRFRYESERTCFWLMATQKIQTL